MFPALGRNAQGDPSRYVSTSRQSYKPLKVSDNADAGTETANRLASTTQSFRFCYGKQSTEQQYETTGLGSRHCGERNKRGESERPPSPLKPALQRTNFRLGHHKNDYHTTQNDLLVDHGAAARSPTGSRAELVKHSFHIGGSAPTEYSTSSAASRNFKELPQHKEQAPEPYRKEEFSPEGLKKMLVTTSLHFGTDQPIYMSQNQEDARLIASVCTDEMPRKPEGSTHGLMSSAVVLGVSTVTPADTYLSTNPASLYYAKDTKVNRQGLPAEVVAYKDEPIDPERHHKLSVPIVGGKYVEEPWKRNQQYAVATEGMRQGVDPRKDRGTTISLGRERVPYESTTKAAFWDKSAEAELQEPPMKSSALQVTHALLGSEPTAYETTKSAAFYRRDSGCRDQLGSVKELMRSSMKLGSGSNQYESTCRSSYVSHVGRGQGAEANPPIVNATSIQLGSRSHKLDYETSAQALLKPPVYENTNFNWSKQKRALQATTFSVGHERTDYSTTMTTDFVQHK